jgi:hypothetical protein
METRLSDRSAKSVSMSIVSALKRYYQVERPITRNTLTGCNDSCGGFATGDPDNSFMWMRRKVSDRSGFITRTFHYFVHRFDCLHQLVVTIRAGMIVRPVDILIVAVVALMTRRVRFLLFRVKKVSCADTAQRTQRRTQILMITRGQDPATSLTKARYPLAITDCQSVSIVDSKQPHLIEIGSIK